MRFPVELAIEHMLERFDRVRRDPARLVDYLRMPRHLVVGGPLSNKLGLQAARALKEEVAYSLRSVNVPASAQPYVDVLDRDGFVVIENFLPERDFAKVESELAAMEALPASRFRVDKFGQNFESKYLFASKFPDEFPAFCQHLRDNDRIYEIARGVSRRRKSYRPHVVVQWLYKPNPNEPHQDFEYNSYLHVDRHYPFMKGFFYLRDVPLECAPYTFVKGSHVFNWERLRFEYKLGVNQSRTRYKKRAEELYNPAQKEDDHIMQELAEELRDRMKLEEVPIYAKKNTLIISNNRGLHRRAEMTNQGPRITANLDFKFFESTAHKLYPLLSNLAPY